jgi:hypothetical protein
MATGPKPTQLPPAGFGAPLPCRDRQREKAILCGVPPEEVSQQLLHRTRDPSALGRSSSQNLDKEDEDNAEYPQA